MHEQPAATLDHLARIAGKPGVRSTLVLSKQDGSIISSTGLLMASSSQTMENDTAPALTAPSDENAFQNGSDAGTSGQERMTVEGMAKLVFSFVTAARSFGEGVDGSDEVKLLRMRTKRSEILIVPGTCQPVSMRPVIQSNGLYRHKVPSRRDSRYSLCLRVESIATSIFCLFFPAI